MVSQLRFKQTEIRKIPKEWRILKIGNILSLEYGEGLVARHRKGDKYPVYGSNGIIGYNSEYLIKGPGIIVGRKGTIGAIRWSEDDFWPIDTTYYIKLKETEIDLKWLSNKLLTLGLSKLNMATGTPGLNRDLVYKLNISIPPLPEQKKIAEILLTIDQAIEEVNRCLAKTERLKKGLMQELLTKGIGHKEFKETEMGLLPLNWDIQKDFIKIKSGYGFKLKEYSGKGIPLIRIDNVGYGKIEYKNLCYLPNNYLDKYKNFTLKKGDIVIALNRPITNNKLKIGIIEIEPSVLYQRVGLIKIHKGDFNINFYYHYLRSHLFLKKLRTILVGSDQPYIKIGAFSKINFPKPPLEEQKKIAKILSTVDERIKLLKEKKEKLGRVKKGLMNNLLTGKKRVKVEA